MAGPRLRRPTVERRIHFYRVHVGHNAAGAPRVFDAGGVIRHLDNLPWRNGQAEGPRYVDEGDGNALCCWVHRDRPNYRLAFGISRRSQLPLVENRGDVNPLGIPANAGLAELTHCVFFPRNIVGAVFNFYGPRVTRLRYYLSECAQGFCPDVTFEAILRPDIAAQLGRLRDVRTLALKVRAPFAQAIRQMDEDIGTALDVAVRAGGAEEVELVLSPAPHRRNWLARRMLALVQALSRRPDLQENVSILRVTGFDQQLDRLVPIDVLNEFLVSTKRVVKEGVRSRALDQTSAYQAIEEAHAELADELARGAGIA